MKEFESGAFLIDADEIENQLSLHFDFFVVNLNKIAFKGVNRKTLIAALLTKVDTYSQLYIKAEQIQHFHQAISCLLQNKLMQHQQEVSISNSIVHLKQLQSCSNQLCSLLNYKFDPFKSLNKTLFSAQNDVIEREQKKEIQVSKQRMNWTGKGKLEELVFQLQRYKLIRTKKDFFNLFFKPEVIQIRIKWDVRRITHLALLFHELYVKGFVRLLSNKGYFNFVENHFVGFDNTCIRKNSLRKISSSIHLHPYKYSDVITDITDILQKLTPANNTTLRTIAGRLEQIKPA